MRYNEVERKISSIYQRQAEGKPVDNAIRQMVEKAARLVLQGYREAHPAWENDKTPIDDLASWLGLYVETFHPDDYAIGTFGFMDPDESEDLVWLCRGLKETLRRFTLAHEIGHAILHCQNGRRLSELSKQAAEFAQDSQAPEPSRADPCSEEDVQEDMGRYLEQERMQATLGAGHNYDPRSEREIAANLFAAELLIPAERLRTLYLMEQVPARTLAATFGVSQAALLNRLAELLLQSSQDEETRQEASVPKQTSNPPTKKRYDEFQQAAIEAPTPALIVAGPGSGKTSTLIGRVEYILNTLGVQPRNILALTFSRKATQEMEERLRSVLTNSADSPDLTQHLFPRVSTFHAFCADLLRKHGERVGLRSDFALIDDAEAYFLLRQQANKMRLRHYQKLQAPTYYFPDMLKAISRAKDELISPIDYEQRTLQMKLQAQNDEEREKAEKAGEVAQVYALYQEALQQRGDTDFGGLIVLAIQLLHEQPSVLHEQQQKYQHILVDEFQDVNRASGVLLRVLAGEQRNVWVVGDANQAIYGFRGASPANIRQFQQDYPGATVLPLSRNYRSRPDLVALAESFRCKHLELDEQPGKNQPVRSAPADTYVTVASAPDEASELAGLVQDIRYRLTQGYAYKDMIILCRTRSQAKSITQALAAVEFPVVEQSSVLEQEHTKDVLSILLLLADTSGMGLLRAARQQEHSLSQQDIETLLLAARAPQTNLRQLLIMGEAPLTMSIEGRHSLLRLSDIVNALVHTSSNSVWALLASYMLLETSLLRNLLLDPKDKQKSARLDDYNRLLQLARHYDQQQIIRQQTQRQQAEASGQELPAPLSLEESVKGFLEYLSLLVLLRQDGGSRQGGDESDAEQANIIRVMTVHASKGLEFPVVYLPGLMQRRFPTQARATPIPTLVQEDEEEQRSDTHESGEACLFYVGITRARDHLILSSSERYGKQKYKRSSYLDALEAGLAEDRILKLQWAQQPVDERLDYSNIASEYLPTVSQPGRDFVNAMRSPTFSASAIEAYQRCPRQYAYSSIYRFTSNSD
ncbi:MAG: UvrD-helicase domain-containing protein, partial [Ktedonobacteraceae bacterium]|nr:UvrD-helicase domain-containing protein [Ktedonobacteraceae bacterium]